MLLHPPKRDIHQQYASLIKRNPGSNIDYTRHIYAVEDVTLAKAIKCSTMDNKLEIAKKISSEIDVHLPLELSDEEMILHIADRVERMLKGDPDLLMSYLYRLDVTQKSIKVAFETSIFPAHMTFANLIWARQKQRMETKKKYKQEPIDGWEF